MFKRRRVVMKIGSKNSLLRLTDDKAMHVLDLILDECNDRSMLWFSSRRFRDEASKKLGISPATVSRCIKTLYDKKIIIKTGDTAKGEYKINYDLLNFE